MPFRKSLDIGNSWELYIAGQLLANRCPIWYPRQTEEECRGSFKGNQTGRKRRALGLYQVPGICSHCRKPNNRQLGLGRVQQDAAPLAKAPTE